MNNVSLRNGADPGPDTRPGRPARWESAAAKQRAYRERCQTQRQLVADLLHAVRNAHWDAPDLAQTLRDGTEAEVLTALIRHYQARHWSLRKVPEAPPGVTEPPQKGARKARK